MKWATLHVLFRDAKEEVQEFFFEINFKSYFNLSLL